MSWTLPVAPSANREFRKLPDWVRDEAVELLAELRTDPLPPDAIELRGLAGHYRVKFGSGRYRLIYRISESRRDVWVSRIRERGTAYRGLD